MIVGNQGGGGVFKRNVCNSPAFIYQENSLSICVKMYRHKTQIEGERKRERFG